MFISSAARASPPASWMALMVRRWRNSRCINRAPAHNLVEDYEFVSRTAAWDKSAAKPEESVMSLPRLSFEFFPPQSLDASFRLWDTVQTLAPLNPNFVSVTYGAGGTTRDLTHEAVSTIHSHYGLNVAAHLTCVEATRYETLAIADQYAQAGVTEIVALRGDPPKGHGAFKRACRRLRRQLRTDLRPCRHWQVPHPRRRLSRSASRSRLRHVGCRLAEAQDRRRCRQRHHSVLLRGRDLLPFP